MSTSDTENGNLHVITTVYTGPRYVGNAPSFYALPVRQDIYEELQEAAEWIEDANGMSGSNDFLTIERWFGHGHWLRFEEEEFDEAVNGQAIHQRLTLSQIDRLNGMKDEEAFDVEIETARVRPATAGGEREFYVDARLGDIRIESREIKLSMMNPEDNRQPALA